MGKHIWCFVLVIITILIELSMSTSTHVHNAQSNFKALGSPCNEQYWKQWVKPPFELLSQLNSLKKLDPELDKMYEELHTKMVKWKSDHDPTGQKLLCNTEISLQCENNVCICRNAPPPHRFVQENNTCLATPGSFCDENEECLNPDVNKCLESKCGGFSAFEASLKLQESDIGITNMISIVIIALSILLNLVVFLEMLFQRNN